MGKLDRKHLTAKQTERLAELKLDMIDLLKIEPLTKTQLYRHEEICGGAELRKLAMEDLINSGKVTVKTKGSTLLTLVDEEPVDPKSGSTSTSRPGPDYWTNPESSKQPAFRFDADADDPIDFGVTMVPAYVQPYPQSALGGQAGLTSADVAKSLGVQHKHVLEKLRRFKVPQNLGFILAVNTAHKSGYILNTDLAKAFVAKWDNELGWGYMRYLLDCEKVVEAQPSGHSELAKALAELARVTSQSSERMNRVESAQEKMQTELTEVKDTYLKGLVSIIDAANGELPKDLCHFEEAIQIAHLPGIGRDPAKHLIKAAIEAKGGTLYTYPRRAQSPLAEDDGKIVYPQFPQRSDCADAGEAVRASTKLVKVTGKLIYLKCDLWRDDVTFTIKRDLYDHSVHCKAAWGKVVGSLNPSD